MAVNKNFVVKNGLQVGEDVIVSDYITKNVGIGTTIGRVTLDVRGGIAATNLSISGIATVTSFNSTNGSITNLTGTAATVTNGSITNLTSTNGSITNLTGTAATIGNVKISSGIISATSGVVTYYGDGSNLTNIVSGVGLATAGGIIGYGATIIYLQGPGISTVTVSSGIGTVNIVGGGGGASISIGTAFVGVPTSGNLWYNTDYGRLFIYYQDTDSAQWVDAAPFNVGIITSLNNVSYNTGSAISPSIYFYSDPQTGWFSPSLGQQTFVSAGSSILNINPTGIRVTGVVTATSFVGNGSGLTGVGIGSTGSVNTTGIITAFKFVGDGSGLTGAGSTVADDTTTNQTFYPIFTQQTSGTVTATKVSTTKLSFNPSDGTLTVIDLNTTSDVNLKTNIHTVENALDVVDNLRGVSFDWKETGKGSYGVIAQELESVLPDLVNGTDPKTVNYNGIIGVLIEAIKELKKEVEELKNYK